jgi:antitoxin (DNA-binding transcriptional repressor) of toxin-antitoxin stability system
MTMIVTNIHEAKAKLSQFLEAVAAGERVVICKRNRPVAELRAVGHVRTEPRPLGGAKGRVSITSAFFEPLADEDLSAFEGTEPRVRRSRAAEKAMPYRTGRSRPRR